MTHPTAVMFLCRQPSDHLRRFAAEVAALCVPLEIFIVCDQPDEAKAGSIVELLVDEEVCVAAGYRNATSVFHKPVIAWDKALYAADGRFQQCWFIEDDVLFADARALARLIDRYAADPNALLCASYAEPDSDPDWPHWATAEAFFPRIVTAHAFVPLCRLSAAVLAAVGEIARVNGRLCYIETMFASIRKSLHLPVGVYDASVASIRFQPYFTLDEARALFDSGVAAVHPFKQIARIE